MPSQRFETGGADAREQASEDDAGQRDDGRDTRSRGDRDTGDAGDATRRDDSRDERPRQRRQRRRQPPQPPQPPRPQRPQRRPGQPDSRDDARPQRPLPRPQRPPPRHAPRDRTSTTSRSPRTTSCCPSPASWTCWRTTRSSAPPATCPGPNDVYVSLAQVKKYNLRKGDAVVGAIRAPARRRGPQPAVRPPEVQRAGPGHLGQRQDRRGAQGPRRVRQARPAVPLRAPAPRDRPQEDRPPRHRPGRPDRQGPARPDRLPAEGRQDARSCSPSPTPSPPTTLRSTS